MSVLCMIHCMCVCVVFVCVCVCVCVRTRVYCRYVADNQQLFTVEYDAAPQEYHRRMM